MTEERMQILKMIEDGKITVDEATKLLDAISHGAEASEAYAQERKSFEEKFSEFANNMSEFAKEVSCKLNAAYKEVEPKIKNFTKTVVEKTANIADNISQGLHEKIKDMEEKDCCEGNGPRPENQECPENETPCCEKIEEEVAEKNEKAEKKGNEN